MRYRRSSRLILAASLFGLVGAGPLLTGCDDGPTSPSDGSCCRVCTTGKACGDSCIARNLTCHKGAGCACNG